MELREREKYENALLTVRFVGEALTKRGVSIYDLATTLLSLQRIFNKAHLALEGRLTKGAYPDKQARTEISLTIGERRRDSDAFALLPLLADPGTIAHVKVLADWVGGVLVDYYLGKILDRIAEKKEDPAKQEFIGAIYADVVNIVHRIDAAGGVKSIEIGSPTRNPQLLADFTEGTKQYLSSLEKESFLGPMQTIEGTAYRLYPSSNFVTIRRKGGRKVNVHVKPDDFEAIRYHPERRPFVSFTGRPRYKFGIESRVITDFEADSLEITEDPEETE